MIHCDLDRRKLITVTSVDQWTTLLVATRNFHLAPELHIAKGLEEGLILDVRYDKNCRSTFLLRSWQLVISREKSMGGAGEHPMVIGTWV